MLKIAFNRKNKTLRSAFTSKAVLQMLEENYKTYCSLNNLMMVDDFNVKNLVESVLSEKTQFSDARAAKMDIDDFLK